VAAIFYYDFNSPYAYLATERIDDLISDAEWRPIAFPILLSELGRLEQVAIGDELFWGDDRLEEAAATASGA
jgi:2-hydroxychromene-2-carboxylate isomerase